MKDNENTVDVDVSSRYKRIKRNLGKYKQRRANHASRREQLYREPQEFIENDENLQPNNNQVIKPKLSFLASMDRSRISEHNFIALSSHNGSGGLFSSKHSLSSNQSNKVLSRKSRLMSYYASSQQEIEPNVSLNQSFHPYNLKDIASIACSPIKKHGKCSLVSQLM